MNLQMTAALNKTGRPIVYSICNWGQKDSWTWAPPIGNLWRKLTQDNLPNPVADQPILS